MGSELDGVGPWQRAVTTQVVSKLVLRLDLRIFFIAKMRFKDLELFFELKPKLKLDLIPENAISMGSMATCCNSSSCS